MADTNITELRPGPVNDSTNAFDLNMWPAWQVAKICSEGRGEVLPFKDGKLTGEYQGFYRRLAVG
jgi:hypothetical protein